MMTTASAAPYLDAFQANAGEPAWLAGRRRAAIDQFAQDGFPTPRQEAWRLTDLRALTSTPFPPALASDDAVAAELAGRLRIPSTTALVLVNGGFRPDLSDALPDGVTALSVDVTAAEALAGDPAQALAALSQAFFRDGFALQIASDNTLNAPLHIIHLGHAATRRSYHLTNLVALGSGAKATLIETFAGVENVPYWLNTTLKISVAERASLDHIRVVADPRQSIHSATTAVTLAADARYDAAVLTIGALLSRLDVAVDILGPNAFCGFNAGLLLRGRQHATIATIIRHAAPGAETREIFKGVAEDQAHAVFQGKIRVERAGQKTSANQMSRSLLLSSEARIDTKPELEIFADDVKCSHGATVGDLNRDALFYLEARGVPPDEARAMLIDAFVTELFDPIADERLRTSLLGWVECWLGRKGRAS